MLVKTLVFCFFFFTSSIEECGAVSNASPAVEYKPKVSKGIVPDDNFAGMFVESAERIKADHNITNLTLVNHSFYNSTFIGNETYFEEYWRNISAGEPAVNTLLSNSHRRATTLQLSFGFPFYGSVVRNITVSTGGFIYTGEHVHSWLAATQYIAPLMANFDTSRSKRSLVKLIDDGSRFSAFWENVMLQEQSDAAFTFAVTLYKNGEIVFAYRRVPIDVQAIDDTHHPVKVGISDAYLIDNIVFYVRRKTIHEYHTVNLKNHTIGNHTLLRLTALPTCLQYHDCATCLTHDTAFNCSWCPQLKKCSSGTDRNQQDWKIKNCESTAVRSAEACAAPADTPSGVPGVASVAGGGNKTVYSTDADATVHDTHKRVDTSINIASASRKFRFDYTFSYAAEGWLKLHLVPAVWSDARLRCHAEGAVLASPLNDQLRDAIIYLALHQPNAIKTIFTGVSAIHSQGDYASIEGVPLLRLAVSWAAGEPDNRDNAERCLAMETAANGSLSDVSCARTLPYVCYKKKAPLVVTSCGTHDPEYVLEPRTGSCYKFHTRGLVWSQAYLTCAAEGGHLAILNSEQEFQVLKEIYNQLPDKNIFSQFPNIAYIGARDWLDGGSWMTIHGETLKEAGFGRWHHGYLSNDTRAPLYSPALCGSIFRGNNGLYDIACDINLPFICEKKPESLEEIEDDNEQWKV